MAAGKPQKQAVAIAYAVKRRGTSEAQDCQTLMTAGRRLKESLKAKKRSG